MGVGGDWKNEVRAVLHPGGRLNRNADGLARAPWIPERGNGLARGSYIRLVTGDRFPWKQTLMGEQWRLILLFRAAGNRPAYWLLDPTRRICFWWGYKDEDLFLA